MRFNLNGHFKILTKDTRVRTWLSLAKKIQCKFNVKSVLTQCTAAMLMFVESFSSGNILFCSNKFAMLPATSVKTH